MNTRHKAVQAGSKLENEINFIKKDRKERKRIFDVDAQDSSTFDLKGPLCSFTHTDKYVSTQELWVIHFQSGTPARYLLDDIIRSTSFVRTRMKLLIYSEGMQFHLPP